MHQVQRLAPQPHHQHLAFRVAEAGIVLDQPRRAVLDHQPDIEHAGIGRAAARHLGHGRAHDFVQRARGDRVVHDRRGRIGAHAAGVGAGVAVAHALVVLRGAEGQAGRAVDQHEERRLLAGHHLLDHHLGAGRAEAAAEHVVDGLQRLGFGLRQDHALAGGEAVGLDHDRRAVFAHVGLGGLGVGEVAVARGGRAHGVADLLGEGLRRLQPRGRRRGPEDREARVAQHVGYAGGQRRLGADDHQVDGVLAGELGHRAAVEDVQVGAFGDLRDARVAGRDDQLVAFRILQRRPGQAVFAPAAAEDEDVHGPRLRFMARLIASARGQGKVSIRGPRAGRPPAPRRRPAASAPPWRPR